ncbi:MAG TPA: tRNA glutamyl-Q(34) synthetase GluQRS [Edaphobacter sp.]|jgi:glutamyl/glutaminyl-tRNA synthetase|nr:tRNA glutamyl-Q(34) synthetase GluQRS [Edaphobacter sp.]
MANALLYLSQSEAIPPIIKEMPSPYIGRLAPSPTGLLHLGHAATFWQAFTRAREHNGTLLLRNEDLDPHRSKPEYVDAMLEDLAWLGITWQPPMLSQSERISIYREALEHLLRQGLAYPCTCSRKDLTRVTQAPHDDDDEPIYNNHCRPSRTERPTFAADTNYRFRVPDNETITFVDRNLGPQSFSAGPAIGRSPENAFGDFLIWRKDNLSSYQLACVIDDADTKITEVVRGSDLLKSTARQILLQRALLLPTPDYFHTQLLTDQHGTRLAKRHDSLAIRALRGHNLSPEEVLQMTTVTSDS